MKDRMNRQVFALLAALFLLNAAFCAPLAACEENNPPPPAEEQRIVTHHDSLDFSGSLSINAQISFLMGLLDSGAEPDIEISPLSLGFGEVEYMNPSDEKRILISNEGDGDLVMAFRNFTGVNDPDQEEGEDQKISDDTRDYTLTSDGLDYDESRGTYTLEPGQSGSISVVFKPRDIGQSEASILCLSNDPDDSEVELCFSGEGIEIEDEEEEDKDDTGSISNPLTGIPFLDEFLSGLEATLQISFGLGQSFYMQDGRTVPMDAAPFAENDRTYVPLRYMGEAIGADVEWDQESQTAHLLKDGQDLTAQKGSNLMWLNDSTAIPMDVQILERDGRLYLPARYVAEQFGYDVDWDAASQQVLLNQ